MEYLGNIDVDLGMNLSFSKLRNAKLCKIKSLDYETASIFVSDNLIYVYWLGGQCQGGVLVGAINTNNEFISIDNGNYNGIYSVYQENAKVFGYSQKFTEVDVCGPEEKIELSYDGNKVVLKKAS